ncbi:uncharacterized protein [Montipora foliosa]|uniref:uncharacterized protein isoform X1 n=1 Tax=Montipora foliosa TaxID=591990 RepID=UPI0035F19C25
MASGSSFIYMSPTLPGLTRTIPPTVLTPPSTSSGTPAVSHFDLDDNQKRWVVIGICLNRLLLPVLQDFVAQEIPKHYTALNRSHGLNTQVYGSHLKQDGAFQLNYASINNNWNRFKRKLAKYDYKVSSAEELGKLYLEPHMAKFTGFDNTCELSAVLGILANASCFNAAIQRNAKDVRSELRNKWGHCNFDHWTDVHFTYCFQVMEVMLRCLGLPKADEDKQVDDLRDWETKGFTLCMSCPVDHDLMKLVTIEVANLKKELEDLTVLSVDEHRNINDALQSFKNEAVKFFKRIEENQEEMSAAIADNAKDIKKIERRQDDCSENIFVLEESQRNLESSLSSVKDQQASLTSEVESLEIKHSCLDSRVRALEEGMFDAVRAFKIVQVPSRNPCFCGRRNELESIASHLKNTKNGCIHSAICGLGGVGKTSLAVEYLCRHEKEYPDGIFWISGENNEIFQRSLSEVARQIGTFTENDFSSSLSKTLQWLGKLRELWCLVVDNLDEFEMSPDMKRLLTGHWKHSARGHIIITTRREVAEISEETGIEEQFCIQLKCLTEDEGIQFLEMRSGKADDEKEARKLVRELGGLPLALDQAGAYIRCLNQSIKVYLEKYKKQKMLLLKQKKARNLVENTSPERLTVHTTWLLNFDHITRISEEMEIGKAPTLMMQVCAFIGPDDIPYELINEELQTGDDSATKSASLDSADIVSLLTKFSLFQRYRENSFSIHRLVQEVIRNQLSKKTTMDVLSCAVRVLHVAFVHTRSPASVCKSFEHDAVFCVESPPSLHLWSKLASHATYLQEKLRCFSEKYDDSVKTLLYTGETMRIFNEAGTFFAVSQEQVKAQEMQKLKLEILVKLDRSASEDVDTLPNYFIDFPLETMDYKLISHCMRQPPLVCEDLSKTSLQKKHQEEANQFREQGNRAVQDKKFEEALQLYSRAIELSPDDHRLHSNRALCHLKLEKPKDALADCEKCLSLQPNFNKALQRKTWALRDLVNSGSRGLFGQLRASLAMAFYCNPTLLNDKTFCEMFSEARSPYREIKNQAQLDFALKTIQSSETLIVHAGQYHIEGFPTFTDFQIVGLGQGVIFTGAEVCCIVAGMSCYFENVVFPKDEHEFTVICKQALVHMNHCKMSGGRKGCEDFPECNGGPGCKAASRGRPVCDRIGKFGDNAPSGLAGHPVLQISERGCALIQNCSIHECGGGGAFVASEGSYLEVRKCEIYKNRQAGLEAREGGALFASENRIFDNRFHGVLIGPDAGECKIIGNKVFENAKEGIYSLNNKNKIVISDNQIHHNGPFGISMDNNSCVSISDNEIFENGFWGINAKSRTNANITGNAISRNKCGGIFIGVNYSGRVVLESNVVRDHSGPWLEHQGTQLNSQVNQGPLLASPIFSRFFYLPEGEKSVYSRPPILKENTEINNKEGISHPIEVAQRLYNGCVFCRRSRSESKCHLNCPGCHIAFYCSEECQTRHLPTHKPLCMALKSRYSVTVEICPIAILQGSRGLRTFGTHLKGIGKGPKLKRGSRDKFIVKIQTNHLNSHPLQNLMVYDRSLSLDQCTIQSPEIFTVIMECGVLGALHKFTSQKAYFWAIFAEGGKKLTVFLDHLAPYQEW